jgi:GntR family transcriptional regulator, transcriptional repressor for pyruvate dehydrogenase complex
VPEKKKSRSRSAAAVPASARLAMRHAASGVLGASKLRRTRRVMKTSELIARDIILDISEGGLKTGDSLPPEAEMLRHYEVGRASLREALRLLEVQGLVQIRAGAKGGPVVGAANAENLARMLTLFFGLAGATYDDLCDVLLIIYPLIAEVIARRKLTREQAQILRGAVERACGVPNPRQLRSETLTSFHSLLTEFSGNTVWALLAEAIALVFADHIISATDSREFHAASIADHKEIADAVLTGNVAGAGKAMREHTERMITFYRAQNPGIFSQLIEWR